MAYEVFDNKAVKFNSPQLTIGKGRIFLNADAGDLLAGLGAKFVHILWDQSACKLAIRPVPKVDGRAFKLRFTDGKRGVSLSAQAFLNYIHWDSAVRLAVPAQWNQTENLLEARLPKEHLSEAARRRGS